MSTHSMHLKYRTPKRYPTIISIMPPGVAPMVTFRGLNNSCIEHIFMFPKRFEPSKFDCISQKTGFIQIVSFGQICLKCQSLFSGKSKTKGIYRVYPTSSDRKT